MFRYDVFKGTFWAMVLATLALAVIVACGSSAPAPEGSEQAASGGPTAVTAQQQAPTGTSNEAMAATAQPAQAQIAPTAMPAGAEVTSQTMTIQPAGKLTMGQKEINVFSGHPALSVNPQLFVISTAPVVEGLMAWNSDLEAVPLLAQGNRVIDW